MKIIENQKLYISYSRQDKDLVSRLSKDLTQNGIDVVYDENLIESGGNWREQIMEGITSANCVLVLITPNSVSSNYVMNELGMARALTMDSNEKKLLLPVIYGEIAIPEFIQDIQVIFWKENFQDVIDAITKAIFTFRLRESKSRKKQENKRDNVITQFADGKNYWLLKLKPTPYWDIENLKLGDTTYFSPYYFGEKRPEFHLFIKIRKGDQVLCFASGNYQSIVFLMEVTDPIAPDEKQGTTFKMVIKKLLSPKIPLKNFIDRIPNIIPSLEQEFVPPKLFFQLDKTTCEEILYSKGDLDENVKHYYQPFYLTEGDHKSTDDQLDFENDINSFGSVIALKKVNPPLAIGLFGNWGSGKSFFMEKLSERIEELAESEQDEYIQHVVQVKFNSWHYSDSNLWASLTTEIFERLHNYAIKKEFGADAINAIYKELSLTSIHLAETQKKLDANKIQEDILVAQKTNLESTIEYKMETLSMWTAKDLIKIVFSDPYIQKDFQNIKATFEKEKLIDNIDQIDEKLSDIDNVRGQFIESIILLKNNGKHNWIWIWIFAIVFAIIGWLVLGPLKETIKDYIEGSYIITCLVLTWLANFITKFAPYFNKISQFFKRLKCLKETIEKEKLKVKLNEQDEVDRLNNDIKRLTAEKATIELKQKQIEEKKKSLEREISDIGSGRLLTDFLSNKSADDAYIKQLGIVSWIRKDFSKLNELFQNQKRVQSTEKELKTVVQIDRIVLYIDDLDRCNENVVVKVLEAIHLLLAFPLFVVVVGVDPRWLNNAVTEKYRNLFNNRTASNQSIVTENDELLVQTASLKSSNFDAASSYDYLEKIFQIPFTLKAINNTGREKLVKYLMRTEMLKETQNDQVVLSNKEYSGEKNDTIADRVDFNISDGIKLEDKHENKLTTRERLVFSQSELEYMQYISPLFGNTPRTINRYVNIYRIIKAHGSLSANNAFSETEYKPIMFILAVIIGFPMLAEEFIQAIKKSNDGDLFGEVFQIGITGSTELSSAIESFIEDIKSLPIGNFKRNIELISRFSFRVLP